MLVSLFSRYVYYCAVVHMCDCRILIKITHLLAYLICFFSLGGGLSYELRSYRVACDVRVQVNTAVVSHSQIASRLGCSTSRMTRGYRFCRGPSRDLEQIQLEIWDRTQVVFQLILRKTYIENADIFVR